MNNVNWSKVFLIALSAALVSAAHEVMREISAQKKLQ